MCLSGTVNAIFNAKYSRDLEIWGYGSFKFIENSADRYDFILVCRYNYSCTIFELIWRLKYCDLVASYTVNGDLVFLSETAKFDPSQKQNPIHWLIWNCVNIWLRVGDMPPNQIS